eukprot:scaffold11568_cov57-Phaeocystis_antarctica.AAC.2
MSHRGHGSPNKSRPRADPEPASGRVSPDPGTSTPGTSARGQPTGEGPSSPLIGAVRSHKCETASIMFQIRELVTGSKNHGTRVPVELHGV